MKKVETEAPANYKSCTTETCINDWIEPTPFKPDTWNDNLAMAA